MMGLFSENRTQRARVAPVPFRFEVQQVLAAVLYPPAGFPLFPLALSSGGFVLIMLVV
jgi:hypothetical protein